MAKQRLGRLERVDLREQWRTEAQDFTPWLALPENMAILSNTLGMELEAAAQEQAVGAFRADILCRDTSDNSWVLIENQLERTDHTHLGQLLTYASGLQTVTVVWVAAAFSDEHRAALDWLNEITAEKFRFFGLEIELWRIGDSLAAPKFNIVSRPNSWSRSAGRAASGEVSERALQQQRFWVHFSEHLSHKNGLLQLANSPARYWTSFGIGRTNFQFLAMLLTNPRGLAVELRMTGDGSVAHYELLSREKEVIQAEVGEELEWRLMDNSQNGRIILRNGIADPTNENDWPDQIRWMSDALEKFDGAFRQRVRDLDASDWQPESEAFDESS